MRILKTGHLYLLENFEPGEEPQKLQFIQKVPAGLRSLKTISNGTTNEEVLKVLIDRMYYLNNLVPSRESAQVINKLEEALMWLSKRTADRQRRQVEGTRLP